MTLDDEVQLEPKTDTVSANQTKADKAAAWRAKRANDWTDVSRAEWQATKKLKTGDSDAESKEERKPKRKVACLIGYCGTGYHGMQLNPPNATIEGTLFDALVKTGAVSRDNADDPKKVSFLRAARTDKGVHAAVNVISLKMVIEDEEIVQKINAELPPQIRLWRVIRTINSFNPRSNCDSRIYEYLIPSSAFLPPPESSDFTERINKYNSSNILDDNASQFSGIINANIEQLKQSAEFLAIKDDDPDVGKIALDDSIADIDKPLAAATRKREKLIRSTLLSTRRQFRISKERLGRLREVLAVFEGVRNFHNYTLGQSYSQPNSTRVIRSFTASEPFLIDGTEWISLKVHGQSFMLHQIRKMVAMAILVIRTSCPIPRMNASFTSTRIGIPKAPALGLLLERPVFEGYNRKAKDAEKGAIEMGELEEEVLRFKMAHIYDKIYAEEASENTFHTFLSSIDAYGGSGDFDFLFIDQND